MYAIAARGAGAAPVAAPEVRLTADVDGLLARVTDKTRILFLANPNNPTGTYLSAEALLDLRAGPGSRVTRITASGERLFTAASAAPSSSSSRATWSPQWRWPLNSID